MANNDPPLNRLSDVWLTSGDGAFEAMLRAIRAAQNSIRLETYIFSDGPVGKSFEQALLEARHRKVEVRVLADAWGSAFLSSGVDDRLNEAGAVFRRFNPISTRRVGFRDHRKLLVCDEKVAFIGGYNITSDEQGDGVSQGWRDLGLRLEGEVAKELALSFDRMFELAAFRHKHFMRFRRSPLKVGPRQTRAQERPVQLLLSSPGRGRSSLKRQLLHDFKKASEIRMVAAYFLPPLRLRRAIAKAARRGAGVSIILPHKTDIPISRLASRHLYLRLLRAGVHLFEYLPQILHAKLIIVDDIVYLGSANMDQRSFHINYELMVRLHQPALAREAGLIFDEFRRHCQPVTIGSWQGSRSFWQRWKERWAYFFLARVDPYLTLGQFRNEGPFPPEKRHKSKLQP